METPITNVKDFGEKKRSVKISEHVIGPVVQNLVGGLSVSGLLILIKYYFYAEIITIKFEMIIGLCICLIANIIRFLILDEGLLMAYKAGLISAQAKNNILNVASEILNTNDNNSLAIEVLGCAKKIISNHFSNAGIDHRTLMSMNFTRTQVDNARALLTKAGIITVEDKKTKFLISEYKPAMLKLKKFVEGK
jgi:hypothetical protein